MRSATALRQEVESSLAARIPGALSVRFQEAPELVATGIREVDVFLRGGLPLRGLSEISGPACSGKTTLVSSLLAGVTQQGGACAYVDVADAFDPLSAAALGIDLGRLLWVRGGRPSERSAERIRESWARLDQALRATDLLLSAGGFRVIVLDTGSALDVGAEQVRRVPLASWYRYRLQAEKAQTLFLLLTQTPCAKSCASVVLHCADAKERWESAAGKGLPLLTGFEFNVSADRKRGALRETIPSFSFEKKPVCAAETPWKRTTLWAR
jgi:hypothetical protein